MSDEVLIRHCAPTLACIKTGSLFTSQYPSEEGMRESIKQLNRRLRGKGLLTIPLRYRKGTGLIYLYRPQRLEADLQDERAAKLLAACGYSAGRPEYCLRQLALRMKENESFPHEIGLFLSYPPEDVDGFIHRHAEAKYCGAWKVYGDVPSAIATFERYRSCTNSYMKRWQQGWSIEQLTVAV